MNNRNNALNTTDRLYQAKDLPEAGSYLRAAHEEILALMGDRIKELPMDIQELGFRIQSSTLTAISETASFVTYPLNGIDVPNALLETRMGFLRRISPDLGIITQVGRDAGAANENQAELAA